MSTRVSTETRGGRTIYRLHDDATRASASILPSYGFNLYDLVLPIAGKPRPVLVSAADFAEKPSNGARNGFPVLFPYPNRVRDGKFSFGGKSYQVPVTLGPNAIHGFALDAAFDVVDHSADAQGAKIHGRYQLSRHSPEQRPNWPGDLVLDLVYTLLGRKLTLDITVTNPGGGPVPYGIGFHPYFRIPFDPGADPSKGRLYVPAAEAWTLAEFLPTGERVGVSEKLDFRTGKPFAGTFLDDVLTGVKHENGVATVRFVDELLRAELRFTMDQNFREIVLYTPPNSPGVISVEPYTQTTDAINLQPKGVDAGLRELAHNAHDSMRLALESVG